MRYSKLMVAMLVSGSLLLVPQALIAFKPNEVAHGHRMITKGVLESGYSFGGSKVDKFSTTLSDGDKAEFTSKAADDVFQGNRSTDQFWAGIQIDDVKIDLEGELSKPVAHCDDELIEECRDRLIALRKAVVDKIYSHIQTKSKEDLGNARGSLGKAFHTIQDFYSHSNFSNINTSGAVFLKTLTDGETTAAKGTLSWGTGITTCVARTESTFGLNGWSNNGGNFRLVDKGLDTTKYTTGWFTGGSLLYGSASDATPGSKCDHGNENAAHREISGLAKDVPYAPFDDDDDMASRPTPTALHARASYHSALHTKYFMESVITAIKAKSTVAKEQDDMIKALLGIEDKPLYGFVIDRTGSMSDIIDGVKTQIDKMITQALASGKPEDAEKRKFLMIDYGDPDVGVAQVGNADQIRGLVSALSASGGGDCPELTNSALKAAVEKAPPKSKLFVFTDASSADGGLAAQVKKIAQDKDISISYAASGSCSPIDPTYYEVAAATGGQVIVVDHTSEAVAAAFTSIDIDAGNTTSQSVINEAGTLTKEKVFNIPVEAGAKRLSVSINSSTGSIVFKSPRGVVVPSAKVTVTDFIGGKGLKALDPEAGVWSVVVTPTGSSAYSLKADIASDHFIEDIKFLTTVQVGKAGHEGYNEFVGNPPLGLNRVEVIMSSPVDSLAVDLVGADGKVIGSQVFKKESPTVFSKNIQIPNQPFRVRVRAKSGSADIVRVNNSMYQPQPFVLDLVNSSQWARGLPGELRLKITNRGADSRFSVEATSDAGENISVPAPVSLKKDEERIIRIGMTVPEAATLAGYHKLNVVVRNASDVAETFSHTFTLAADTDGDGVPDVMEQGMAGNNAAYDGNRDGQPDWKQANVISLYSRLNRGYVTYAAPKANPFKEAYSLSLANASADNTQYPYDLFNFKLAKVSKNAVVKLKLYLPASISTPDYVSFSDNLKTTKSFKAASQFKLTNSVVEINLTDGALGDNGVAGDGVINHIGAVKDIMVIGHINKAVDKSSKPPAQSSGGGGGAISIWALFSLMLLAILRRTGLLKR